MNEKFLKLLKNLDLTNYQIKIYFSCLKNGMSTVLDISKDTKINRSQIYLDAPILVEKGLLEVGSKRNRRYLAVNPKRLEKLVEEKEGKLKELKSVLGEVGEYFERREKRDEANYDLRIFEGKNKVKDAFMFELESSKSQEIVSFVGDIDEQFEVFSEEFWRKFNKQHIENGGTGRMIVNRNNVGFSSFLKNEKILKMKGLENFSLKVNVDVWGTNSLIVAFDKTPKAVLLKNKLVADAFRQIFERLWQNAD